MEYEIDWSTSAVEHGKLSVGLEPAPDFAFMMEFDRIVDPVKHPDHVGWGAVILAHGRIVVGDVDLGSAQQLRSFLDETVREANLRAVETRAREEEKARAEAAEAARQEAEESAAARAAAERDARLTDAFRASE